MCVASYTNTESWELAMTKSNVSSPLGSLSPFNPLKAGKSVQIPKAPLFPGYSGHPSLPAGKI